MSNRAVILTISDRCHRGEVEDRGGPAIFAQLPAFDAVSIHHEIIPDERDRITNVVRSWLGRCDLLITTGGTGVAARDVTPEAIEPLIDRPLPGFGEVMRMRAFERLPLSILSRGGGGIAGNTLIVWLPGSPKAVTECLQWLAPAIKHACQFLRGEKPH